MFEHLPFHGLGGTTMRRMVYHFARNSGYNMTTIYGLNNECQSVPFSCNIGEKVNIIYGHRNENIPFFQNNTLHVVMIREPLSWLLSRIQHDHRKRGNNNYPRKINNEMMINKSNFNDHIASSEGIIHRLQKFSPKYLMYARSRVRVKLEKWFQELHGHYFRDDNHPRPYNFNANKIATTLKDLENDFRQQKLLVLITEHYSKSLQLLGYVFNSSLFNGYSNDAKNNYISNAASSKQNTQSVGTYQELKQLNYLLSPHLALYHAAFREFIRQLDFVNMNS